MKRARPGHLQGTPIQYKILVLVQKTPNQLSAVFVIVPAFAAARFDFQFGCDGRVPPRARTPKNNPHASWKFSFLLLTDARILRSRPEGVPCYLGWKSRARKWRRLGRAARAPSRSTPLSPSRPLPANSREYIAERCVDQLDPIRFYARAWRRTASLLGCFSRSRFCLPRAHGC